MDSCDVCGKQSSDMYSVLLEGARMIVCEKCSRGNKIIAKIESGQGSSTKSHVGRQKEDEVEVVEDYGDIIRKARESTGLNIDQFAMKINERASGLRRVEEGRTLPTVQLTEKLEKELGIKLTAPAEKSQKSAVISKDEPITLWDAAYKKEKKQGKEGE